MSAESHNSPSGARDASSGRINQLLRAVLVIAILLITPSVVFHLVVPIILSHRLGIFVAVPLVAMMGVGVYTIAEGELPSIFKR
ncbi:hypothetical protein ACT4ML_15440 [Natrinema sp. LN54]|uniref:hypothetical protein n=1 Tax=Natrinema sp. LN54 TaxID=3458705 RepID=UPI0040370DCB